MVNSQLAERGLTAVPNLHREVNNYDVAKAIAAMCMLIDHLGYFFWEQQDWMRVIGRIAFPIYAILHGMSYRRWHMELLEYTILFEVAVFWLMSLAVGEISWATTKYYLPLHILTAFTIYSWVFPLVWKGVQCSQLGTIGLTLLVLYKAPLLDRYLEYGPFVLLFMLVGKLLSDTTAQCSAYFRATFIGIVILGFLLDQSMGFDLDLIKASVVLFELVLIIIWLQQFTIRPITIKNPVLRCLIYGSSRYSLQLYCVHYIAFMLCVMFFR